MINYWWVTRPKRKLNTVPEVLALFAEISLNQLWDGQRTTHLEIEAALEREGLKKPGSRRDQTGGGGRTYRAWLESLGLLFKQEKTGQLRLTLAGEDILAGKSPVEILKGQVLKYQFPSSFSISPHVAVSDRFKIRPFRFLLRLLSDPWIEYLTEEEIAKIVSVEAENEGDKCYRHVVDRIHEYRSHGDDCLTRDFHERYRPSKGETSSEKQFGYLLDLANTLVNWLEYTLLIERFDGRVRILAEKCAEVKDFLATAPPFVDRPEQHEYFQRKYGIPPGHKKDTRDFLRIESISTKLIVENQIKRSFFNLAVNKPISSISRDIIDEIEALTGIGAEIITTTLETYFPRGAISAFLSEYHHLAFSGRENAKEFELATVEIFRGVFGFVATHVGPIGLTPDVAIVSDADGFSAIIDNKAYARYSLSNDHRNRMIYNYIPKFKKFGGFELAFFSYLAGGFAPSMSAALQSVVNETGVHGSGVSVSHIIEMVERQAGKPYSHASIRKIFSVDRVVSSMDLRVF